MSSVAPQSPSHALARVARRSMMSTACTRCEIDNVTAAPSHKSGSKGAGVVTGAGLAAGLVAIAASSCCVLPIVFVGLGLGGAAAVLIPALAAFRPYLVAAAVLAVVAAWLIYLHRRPQLAIGAAGGRFDAARRAPIWLVLASAVVFLATIWQAWIEPLLLTWTR